MKKVALSELKDDLSRYLRLASEEEVVITRHGRAAGVLIGFASEDDWCDYRLENDPGFLSRVSAARASLRAGRGIRLEDVEDVEEGSEAHKETRSSRERRSGGASRRERHGSRSRNS